MQRRKIEYLSISPFFSRLNDELPGSVNNELTDDIGLEQEKNDDGEWQPILARSEQHHFPKMTSSNGQVGFSSDDGDYHVAVRDAVVKVLIRRNYRLPTHRAHENVLESGYYFDISPNN